MRSHNFLSGLLITQGLYWCYDQSWPYCIKI